MTTTQKRTRWRTVALPTEHGGWGIALAPVVLGLLVVPSLTGVCLGLIVFVSFLARTPLKIVWKDVRNGRRYARTQAAVNVLLLYTGLIIFGGIGAMLLGGIQPILPLLLASPLIAIQLYYDFFFNGRHLLPELVGPVAVASVVCGMALAVGWTWPQALALWAIPVLRILPSILFVRSRIKLDRNKPVSVIPVHLAHVAALTIGLILAWFGLIPYLTTLAYFILLLWALYGLSSYRRPMAIKTIGWSEMGFSLMTVMFTAIGYWLW
ncbi:MAG: hypothetical protein CSB13_11445 [Chloroflexi bacterium]|nr:MAG: hypothetical protein CSB13_11445 [Chloroflexota bacterium]